MSETRSASVDAIVAIMARAFDPHFNEAWTRRQVEDSLSLGNARAFLVDALGNRPTHPLDAVGFVLSRSVLDEEELLLLAILPEHRGRSLSKVLLDALFASARERGIGRIFLEMREGNPAENAYRAYRFEPIGRRPDYYRTANGERIDAITFARAV